MGCMSPALRARRVHLPVPPLQLAQPQLPLVPPENHRPFSHRLESRRTTMDNPHQETQALLLTRIIKTVEKCNEAFKALNGHLSVRPSPPSSSLCVRIPLARYHRHVTDLGRAGRKLL